uniref:Threonine aspartase n=1 Tax=Timema cristinae TaxID=61476 RepID=A0A7R9D1I6_TIMCR|nr:unnamed protein product [Timema cristinae]
MLVLKKGGTALEAVMIATATLEDSPLTNAGYGSTLTWDGKVECDASVMDGRTLQYGAVGAVSGVKNPVKLAHHLCFKQNSPTLALGRVPPCLLVGSGARKWAKRAGIQTAPSHSLVSERLNIEAFSWRQSEKPFSKNRPQYTQPGLHPELLVFSSLVQNEISALDLLTTEIVSPLDTVGAVSMDSEGNVASACSSGGIALKHSGRVGQAGVYGCGCWAENTDGQSAIAACTSGCGEYLVKTCLAREVSQDIKVASCCITGLHNTMTNKFVNSPFLRNVPLDNRLGGVIVLKCSQDESTGEFLWAHSTSTMMVSYMSIADRKPKISLSMLPKGIAPGSQVIVEAVPFKRRLATMDCQTINYVDLTL